MELSSLNELLDRIAAQGVATDYDQIGPKTDLREINSCTTHIININQAGVGFYLHREGPNLGKNIMSLVSCYHPPRRTVRDPLPEIRQF